MQFCHKLPPFKTVRKSNRQSAIDFMYKVYGVRYLRTIIVVLLVLQRQCWSHISMGLTPEIRSFRGPWFPTTCWLLYKFVKIICKQLNPLAICVLYKRRRKLIKKNQYLANEYRWTVHVQCSAVVLCGHVCVMRVLLYDILGSFTCIHINIVLIQTVCIMNMAIKKNMEAEEKSF